LQHIYTL